MEHSFQFAEWENQGKTIRASIYFAKDKEVPWVVLCHGFTSHRIGPNYLFVTIARYLASQGFCSVAFDFSGCGESDGFFSETTISSMCSDLLSCYNIIRDNYEPSKFLLLGHSFGGVIVALTAHKIFADGLILLSPLADIKKHTESYKYIINKGENKEGFYEFGPHEMSIKFFQEMKECDPVSIFSRNFKGSMILLQGDNDEQITVEESLAYIDAARKHGINSTYHIVKNADHRFSTVQCREFLNSAIANWIKEIIL